MKVQFLVAVASCIGLLSVAATSSADFAAERLANWHQWRGPNADGVAANADPPSQWSGEKNVKWKAPVRPCRVRGRRRPSCGATASLC
jgi:hypothetical protein